MIVNEQTPKYSENSIKLKHLNFPYRPFVHQFQVYKKIYTEHLLLKAPTASGKTAAVFYPIADYLREEDPGAFAFFVYPTRALISDQKTTIEQICVQNNLSCTKLMPGMSTTQIKMALADNRIILTTPDILYFIFFRGYQHFVGDVREVISYTNFLVFDEIHTFTPYMLLNFKILINLIRSINECIRIVCMTATMDRVVEYLREILPFTEINGESYTGRIDVVVERGGGIQDVVNKEQLQQILDKGKKAVLIFNSVERAELFRKTYNEAYWVFGQTKQQEKEREENLSQFTKADTGILISSPIVEQGIDFRVDEVITEEPFDYASMIQRFGRIGRGGRAGKFTIVTPSTRIANGLSKDMAMTRSEFELQLSSLFHRTFLDRKDIKKMMLAQAYLFFEQNIFNNTTNREIVERMLSYIDIKEFKNAYETYAEYLPDNPSFRDPCPCAKITVDGTPISIWDILQRGHQKHLSLLSNGEKSKFIIASLNMSYEQYRLINRKEKGGKLNIVDFKRIYLKDLPRNQIFGKATIEIPGSNIRFQSLGFIHDYRSNNTYSLFDLQERVTRHFQPEIFAE